MATAPPAGTVFATAVVVSVCTSAWGYVIPGVASTVTIQYVARFHTANTNSTTSSTGVMALISAHTSEKSATLWATYQTTAANKTNESAKRTRCCERLRDFP